MKDLECRSLLAETPEKSEAGNSSCCRTRFTLGLLGVVVILAVACTYAFGVPMVPSGDNPGSTWPKQAKILEQMVLYQKVRLLKNLTAADLQKHHIDVVSLPAFGPEFFEQEEKKRLARMLGYKTSLKDGNITITKEDSRDVFVRVSECWCDVSLVCLKMMAALLSLEASIHVCNLPPTPAAASSPSVKEFEKVWTGGNRLLQIQGNEAEANGRRLAFNVPSASVENKSVEEARMSCASQINGILSSFLAVSQYISDSQYSCPAPQNVKNEYAARCSMSISVLTSGLGKSAAALSDIAVECKDPTAYPVPYSRDVAPNRVNVVFAACLNNIGQAITYLAKVGYQLNSLATSPGKCPEYPTQNERYVCFENIASLLADIGQVATYLSASASGCGDTTLVPFGCSSRIAATVTGLFDAVQGIGGALAWCNHPGPLQRKVAGKLSQIEEDLHDKKYTRTFPLP